MSKRTPSTEERALTLLKDPDFFGQVRGAVERGGLVGEAQNGLAIYVIAISSLLEQPMNAIVKGPSSTGKNLLVSRVLRLMPETAIREITSSSRMAWNYSGDDFRNRIVYLKERTDDAAGAVASIRLFISESELRRTVTVRKNGQLTTQTFVAKGPIAAISTTTRDRIQIDDETRHVSLWVDESPEQTRRVIDRQVSPLPALSEEEIRVWHEVYNFVSKRSSVPVKLPEWFKKITDKVDVSNVRVRRYFPAFLAAVRTITLIRSFSSNPEDFEPGDSLRAGFDDYAIATYIFDTAFVESLSRGDDERLETSKAIATIYSTQNDEPVVGKQFAEYLGISYGKATAKLRRS